MKPIVDEALAEAPSVQHVIVHQRLGADVHMKPGRDLTWDECAGAGEAPGASRPRTRSPRTC